MGFQNYPLYDNKTGYYATYQEQEEMLRLQREEYEKAKAYAMWWSVTAQQASQHQIGKSGDVPKKQSNKKLLLLTP